MSATTLRLACFGKLPIHGDFIRETAEAPELGILDDWLQAGIARAMSQLGQSFRREFVRTPPLSFVYRSPQTGGVLAGVCVPSRDRPGRLYPFLVASRLPDAAPGDWLDTIPAGAGEFLARARGLATHGWEQRTLASYRDELRRQSWEWDPAAAAAALDAALAETPLVAHFGAVLAERNDPATMATLWAEVVGLTAQATPAKLVARLAGAGTPIEVACWLRLLGAAAKHRVYPVFVAWSDDRRPVLSVVHDDLSGRYFTPVFWPETENDSAHDLGRQVPGAPDAAARAFLDPLIEGNVMLADLVRAAATARI